MRTYYLTYWTEKPRSVLIKEKKKFRNSTEAYRYIFLKNGIAVFVTENYHH
jgi:hypothetical protein